ncbi:MAG: chloride channel protein [Burkholderiales bacterium]|nr:chloride channel protein [Burkholderiales bacterium]
MLKLDDVAAQENELAAEIERDRHGLAPLCAAAVAAGLLVGLVGAAFRRVLEFADALRLDLVQWSGQLGAAGVLVPVAVVAACAALARLMVRYAPEAAGSGVQRVEAVMRGETTPARLRALPVKFFGGSLALGAGLALGREGPTVQMGATIGARLARWARLADDDVRNMSAAVAGAGLGVAFSAPIGGAIFTFEEVRRAFTLRLVVTSVLACSAASGVALVILGDLPDFKVSPPAVLGWTSVVPVMLLGALLGVLGVGYNRLIVALLDLTERFPRVPPEAKAALIGAVVGLLLWHAPHVVGGGDYLNQRTLDGAIPVGTLALVLALRWVLGPFCYAAGTPGGIFAPLLLVGSAAGTLFAIAWNHLTGTSLDPLAFAIIGMSTFFAAVVRAPFTGIMLIVEMTATTTQVMPTLAAVGVAIAVATGLRALPVYDTLRLRMLERDAAGRAAPSGGSERSRPGG